MSISWLEYKGILSIPPSRLGSSWAKFCRFPHSLTHILILILPQNITINKVMTATEAEIEDVMGDGMADVEMEAIAIGMGEETPTGGTEDKGGKEKDLL